MAKYFYKHPCGKVVDVELSAKEQRILKNVTHQFRVYPRLAAKVWLTVTGWYTEQEVDEFLADKSMSVYQIFCNHTQNNYAEIKTLVDAYKWVVLAKNASAVTHSQNFQKLYQEVA